MIAICWPILKASAIQSPSERVIVDPSPPGPSAKVRSVDAGLDSSPTFIPATRLAQPSLNTSYPAKLFVEALANTLMSLPSSVAPSSITEASAVRTLYGRRLTRLKTNATAAEAFSSTFPAVKVEPEALMASARSWVPGPSMIVGAASVSGPELPVESAVVGFEPGATVRVEMTGALVFSTVTVSGSPTLAGSSKVTVSPVA